MRAAHSRYTITIMVHRHSCRRSVDSRCVECLFVKASTVKAVLPSGRRPAAACRPAWRPTRLRPCPTFQLGPLFRGRRGGEVSRCGRRGKEATRRGGRKQEGASAAPRARRPSPRRSTQMNHYLQINMPKGHCAATSCSTDARGRLARSLGPASSEALMPWRQALMPCFRVLNYVAGLAREVG